MLKKENGFIWVGCPGPRDLKHQTKGQTFRFETHAMEFFWEGAWFSIGVSMNPETRETRFYCNLHEPFVEVEAGLEFVDLDIDVVKNGDAPCTQEDLDEFAVHREKYAYPPEIVEKLPDYGVRLGSSIDEDLLLSSKALAELFDQVMVEGGPTLSGVPEESFTHLSKWPLNTGPGLSPFSS